MFHNHPTSVLEDARANITEAENGNNFLALFLAEKMSHAELLLSAVFTFYQGHS